VIKTRKDENWEGVYRKKKPPEKRKSKQIRGSSTERKS
jgi:hypothetical protein